VKGIYGGDSVEHDFNHLGALDNLIIPESSPVTDHLDQAAVKPVFS
jgi:hypothetical protein